MKPKGISRSLVVALMFAFLLTGCTASQPTYSVLDSAAESEDALPETLPSSVGNSADLATSRLVGEYDGVPLWLLPGRESSTVCLLAFPNDDDWVMGCAGDTGAGAMEGPTGKYTYQPDGFPAPQDATRISTNVYAVDQTR
jgi:hypothetical protein